jgi:hypothetical protein
VITTHHQRRQIVWFLVSSFEQTTTHHNNQPLTDQTKHGSKKTWQHARHKPSDPVTTTMQQVLLVVQRTRRRWKLGAAYMVLAILTADQVLHQGLNSVEFRNHRVQNVSRATNVERFRGPLWIKPSGVCTDLGGSPAANTLWGHRKGLSLVFDECSISWMLPTEAQLAATFNVCGETVRKWCWFFARKIQELKDHKVCINICCWCCTILVTPFKQLVAMPVSCACN